MRHTLRQTTPRADNDRPALVTPDWLTGHLDDPEVRVIEVDVSPAAHDQGHIPGAVLWNIYTDIKDENYDFVGRTAFEELVRQSGIDKGATVVFYGYAPAFGFWLLRLFGHDDVRILDADRATWQAEHHPWTSATSVPAPSQYILGQELPALRASLTDVRDGIDEPALTTIDVRSTPEYLGERFWPSGGMHPDGRAGHVPDAVSLPADAYVDERGAFRSWDELSQQFPEFDGSKTDPLITYCTIGARACTAWFVLSELLGHHDVRVYDGSWAQWGRTAAAPVDTGEPGASRRKLGDRLGVTCS